MKFYLLALLFICDNNTFVNKKEEPITITGKVINIIDGDTFDLLKTDSTTIRVRMNGIDCPERSQDFYQVAKDALASYIFEKEVKLESGGNDRYNRVLADVYFENEYINLKMIVNGYAWHYKKYSTDMILARAEINAQDAHLGLWIMKNPIAPWDYRHPKK